MKMADFRKIVTTVPFTLTIINLTTILGNKVALITFSDFEQSFVVELVNFKYVSQHVLVFLLLTLSMFFSDGFNGFKS